MVAVLFLCCCASGVWGSNNPRFRSIPDTQTFSCSRPTWIFTGSSLPSNSAPGGAVLDTGSYIQQVLGAAASGWGRQGSLHSLGTQPVSRGSSVTHHSFPNLYSPLSPPHCTRPRPCPRQLLYLITPRHQCCAWHLQRSPALPLPQEPKCLLQVQHRNFSRATLNSFYLGRELQHQRTLMPVPLASPALSRPPRGFPGCALTLP